MKEKMETNIEDIVLEEDLGGEFDVDLEASADSISDENDVEESLNALKDMSYTIKLSKTYNFNDIDYDEVDLSGLEDLTTKDAQDIDKLMTKMGHRVSDKFRDTLYTKHIAMKVTGLPADFFNMLRWKDMENVKSRITIYFLF